MVEKAWGGDVREREGKEREKRGKREGKGTGKKGKKEFEGKSKCLLRE